MKQVVDAGKVAWTLRERGALDLATLAQATELDGLPLAITRTLLATAHRDLRALATTPARALAREHRKTLARFGTIDDAWLAQKEARLDTLARALSRVAPREPAAWFEGVLELARAVHGEASATFLDMARVRLTALGAERRRVAETRVEALAKALDTGEAPEELAPLVARLERARDVPGRARRSRVLDVLRTALGWPDAPAEAVRALADRAATEDFAEAVRRAGRTIVRSMPAPRDPEARDRALSLLAFGGLLFPVGPDGVPLMSGEEIARAHDRANKRELESMRGTGVTFAQALAIAELPFPQYTRKRVAQWVAEGLELDLLVQACTAGRANDLTNATSARAARAYATWATRLVPHYASLGIDLKLSPELFGNLPKNEDLGVLAVCLMEQERGKVVGDPLALLDATLGLFQKLPGKVSGILGRLRGTTPGAGRATFPDLAAWLDDDALLDQYVHLTRLAGLPVALSHKLREDFDHAEKAGRERAHLEAMPSRSSRQETRLAALKARDRSLGAAPRGRTRRRLAERVDVLLPLAYRREIDATFREILRDAWGITVPSLTPAWRDAVRFWLVVDDNRELLGQLLRAAAAAPGRDVKRSFAKNLAWLEKAKFRTEPWLAPRREALADGFTVEMEEDPLEVLRMGIPFGTCLALETGFNAASTVVNAVDVNKRVLYVRTRDGKVVARKLLAITTEQKLVGYNFYVATRGPEERAIREAVSRMCRAIAEECGLGMATSGEPERLHGTFWYDDGTVAFEGRADVAAYCRALGLAPPPKDFDSLTTEAEGQAAIGAGDVEAALAALTRWDRGPSNARLGKWIVHRLGEREAIRRAAENNGLVEPLLDARDEAGMLRALALAPRLPDHAASGTLSRVLPRVRATPRLLRALTEMAVRAARSPSGDGDHGLAHSTFNTLAQLATGFAETFDALDALEPAWDAVVRSSPRCAACRESAVVQVVARLAEMPPDEDAIAACLSTRRRGHHAQRVALGLAARRSLAGGARAVGRVLTLRPELAKLPEALAATLRQRNDTRAELPSPEASPYEALGDLLFTVDGVERHLPIAPLEGWEPGPWELAFHRRRDHGDVKARLLASAIRTPMSVSREMELLALLGDVGAFEAIARAESPKRGAAPVTPPKTLQARTQCESLAKLMAEQIAAADEGRLTELRGERTVDRRLVDVAVGLLREKPSRGAAEIVCAAPAGLPLGSLVVDVAAQGSDDVAVKMLEGFPAMRALTPEQIAALWEREGLRGALLDVVARFDGDEWSAIAMAAGAPGLFEAWASALVARGAFGLATDPETTEQLRDVIRVVTASAHPSHAAGFYEDLPDELSAALFLRALAEQPEERVAAIREAARKLSFDGPRGLARRAWLDSTSLRKARSSSIEVG